ncbi:MAG: S41 family peptidase [Candidatus Poribacteria bacterium]|nr:S41 family peptidase [Candidatus Poribacteria bacterium]
MKKYLVLSMVITILTFVILPMDSIFADEADTDNNVLLENIALFSEILAIIEQQYLENPDKKEQMEGAIKGMLRTLDPYSQFIPDYIAFRTQNQGNYGGVGMTVGMRDDIITVITPFKGNPAALAGVQSGDIISQIDGESTAVMSLDDAVDILRGEPGTSVSVTLIRPKVSSPIEVTITREVIRIPSVEKEMIGDKIGYIKINTFLQTTANDVDNALEEFKQNNIRGIILDLRFNPGGLLSSAVSVSSDFLEPEQLVVYSQGKNAEDRNPFYTDGTVRDKLPLIVLVNNGSASASEIVAGAIRDHRRGLVMGSQTFGKASVQKVFSLSDSKAAVKLTVAHYFTPNGVDIHKVGIIPDVETAYFSQAEQRMQIKLRNHQKVKTFIEENGDDVLEKLFAAEHAPREDRQAAKILRSYRRLTDALTEEQIILSDIGIKYAIALETKNIKDEIIHDPQVTAAIEQLKVLELFAKKN